MHAEDKERHSDDEWTKLALRVGVTTLLHPLEYAKTLMQVGFEPIAPVPGRTLLGSPTMVLPNIFQYAGYIGRTNGFLGLYTGLQAKVAGMLVGTVFSHKIARALGMVEEEAADDLEGDELKQLVVRLVKRDLVLHTSSIILSHPFQVVSIRMMAQFVGQETKYTSIFGSLATIIREEGVLGLFTGLVPRLLCDLSTVILTATTTYMVHRHLIKEKEARLYFGSFNGFIWSGVFYPFLVCSTCTIVSGSGLAAGRPPNMPLFNNWNDCFRNLKADGELKRGSAVFFRYAKPKIVRYSGSAPYPTMRYN